MDEQNQEKNAQKQDAATSKWRSRKWFVTLWCMAMVTGIVVFSFVTGSEQFVMLATTLAAEPIAYMSIQAIGKNKPRVMDSTRNGQDVGVS